MWGIGTARSEYSIFELLGEVGACANRIPCRPVKAGEDERAGRWKGTTKTECGIHNSRSKYAQYLREQERKREAEELHKALEKGLNLEEADKPDAAAVNAVAVA